MLARGLQTAQAAKAAQRTQSAKKRQEAKDKARAEAAAAYEDGNRRRVERERQTSLQRMDASEPSATDSATSPPVDDGTPSPSEGGEPEPSEAAPHAAAAAVAEPEKAREFTLMVGSEDKALLADSQRVVVAAASAQQLLDGIRAQLGGDVQQAALSLEVFDKETRAWGSVPPSFERMPAKAKVRISRQA